MLPDGRVLVCDQDSAPGQWALQQIHPDGGDAGGRTLPGDGRPQCRKADGTDKVPHHIGSCSGSAYGVEHPHFFRCEYLFIFQFLACQAAEMMWKDYGRNGFVKERQTWIRMSC